MAVKPGLPISTEKITLTCDFALMGYGNAFWHAVADRLHQEHPNLTVQFNEDPRIWEVLQPKFVTGDVPDFAYPGWQADVWKLAYEGQLYPPDEFLDAPAYGQTDKKVRDTWDPRAIEHSSWNGKFWVMPLVEVSWGFWYNQALFREKGWKVPTMWDEFIELCKEIKDSGIWPLSTGGKSPTYWDTCIHQGLLYKLAGIEFVKDVDNLVPGVWKRPVVKEAIQMERELWDKYLQPEAVGFATFDSQVEWLKGNCALVVSGTWLENEMRDQIPQGFQFGFFPVPGVRGGKGDPTSVRTWFSEYQIIPAKSKHPYEAMEYYRIFFSAEFARKFAEMVHDTMPILGRTEGVQLTPAMASVEAARKASKETYDYYIWHWYKGYALETSKVLRPVLQGEITVEEYGDRMEALAAKVRDDPSIVKRRHE
ncbi:MAG: extracellular solute-binding protein [Anaerolineae bacterium]